MSSRHLRHDTVMSGLTLQAPGDRVHSVVVTATNSSRITTNLQWLQLVKMKLWEKSVEIMDRAAGAGGGAQTSDYLLPHICVLFLFYKGDDFLFQVVSHDCSEYRTVTWFQLLYNDKSQHHGQEVSHIHGCGSSMSHLNEVRRKIM